MRTDSSGGSVAATVGGDSARAVAVRREGLRIGGTRVATERSSEVFNPYTRALVGTVARASVAEVRRAIGIARSFRSPLTPTSATGSATGRPMRCARAP